LDGRIHKDYVNKTTVANNIKVTDLRVYHRDNCHEALVISLHHAGCNKSSYVALYSTLEGIPIGGQKVTNLRCVDN